MTSLSGIEPHEITMKSPLYVYIYIYMYIYVPLIFSIIYTVYISFRAIPANNIKSIKSGEIAKKTYKNHIKHTHTPKKKNKNDSGLQRGEKHKGNAAMIQSKLEHLVEHFWLGQIFVGILISNMSFVFFVYVPICVCVFFFVGHLILWPPQNIKIFRM